MLLVSHIAIFGSVYSESALRYSDCIQHWEQEHQDSRWIIYFTRHTVSLRLRGCKLGLASSEALVLSARLLV